MIKIVSDSSSDLPPDLADSLGIAVVPLHIRFGEEEFVDREELSSHEFWSRLVASEVLPETSAPSAGAFADTYDHLADAGATGIVAVCLSSQLSATYQSAVIAAEKMDRIPVRVVDSQAVSMALGLQVLSAHELTLSKNDVDSVANSVRAQGSSTNIFAALDTLDFLKRGGRIGSAQALVGGLLDVKPLISFEDGAVVPAGRVRTFTKAKAAIVDHVAGLAPRLKRLAVIHGASPEVDSLTEAVRGAAGGVEPIVAELGPVVGTHSGPGAVGVAYQLT